MATIESDGRSSQKLLAVGVVGSVFGVCGVVLTFLSDISEKVKKSIELGKSLAELPKPIWG